MPIWALPPLQAKANAPIAELRSQARTLFAARQFPESAEVWRRLLALAPQDEEGLSRLGVIEGILGHHDVAAQFLERAVRRNPRSAANWNNLAVNQMRRNKPKEAAESLEQALRIAPSNGTTLYNLGSIRFEQNRCDQALPPLEKARQIAGPDLALDLKITLCLAQSSEPEKATAFWRESQLLQSSDDPEIHLQLARGFYGAGQDDVALRVLDGSLSTAALHALRAEILDHAGRLTDALVEYEKAIQLQPNEPSYYLKLISTLLLGKATTQARTIISSAKERFAKDERFLVAEAYSWQVEGDRDRAIGLYAELVKSHPGSVAARVFLAHAYQDTGRPKDAIEQMKLAVATSPQSARAHYQLGMMMIAVGGVSPEAVSHLKTAATLDPNYFTARYQLGKILRQQGDLPGARDQLEAAVKLAPGLPEPHYALGQIYRRLGLDDQAAAQLKLHQTLRALDRSDARENQLLVYDLQ